MQMSNVLVKFMHKTVCFCSSTECLIGKSKFIHYYQILFLDEVHLLSSDIFFDALDAQAVHVKSIQIM